MIEYPKIEYYNANLLSNNIIAWDKLDGQNFRATFSKSKFYKFGTRNVMIDENDPIFGKIIPMFIDKYSDVLGKIFIDKYKKDNNFTVFGEYVGENSFAGIHSSEDKMDIILFDVYINKKGFINTYEFLDKFGHLSVPNIIYEGKYTEEFISDIKSDKYNLKEGVIVKGFYLDKDKKEVIFMNKIKCNHWLLKVKENFGSKYLLEELNNNKLIFKEYE